MTKSGAVPFDADYDFLIASGVKLDEASRRAAVDFARQEGVDAVDLIPPDLSAMAIVGAILVLNPDKARNDRLARGSTTGCAMLVKRALLEKAGIEPSNVRSVAELVEAAVKVKRYAANGVETLVTPGATAAAENPFVEWKAYRALFGARSGPLLTLGLGLLAMLWSGLLIVPAAGAVSLLVFHLQPLIMQVGTSFRPRRLLATTLFRTPWMIWEMAQLAVGSVRSHERKDQVQALRPVYERLFAEGRGRFFGDRIQQCPVCGSARLDLHVKTGDLLQGKPGEFRLERCGECGHIFQNPRLTPAGLDYYYKDFYDGLGKEDAEAFFACGVKNQKDQVATVAEVCRPARWLDVGAGHSHFCQVAKARFPGTHFEGLDISESIEEAERCGWIAKAHRGFFPELAAEMPNQFDLVSMFHYLEHTVDQRAELAAAYITLAPGGHLVIEVPDPECIFGQLLGKYWLPWLQPQHLHLISTSNLHRLLRDCGFEPALSTKVKGSEKVSLLFAALMLIHHVAPDPNVPWRPPASTLDRARFLVGKVATPPLLMAGFLADRIAGSFMPSSNIATAYRVVARCNKTSFTETSTPR